MISLNKPLAEFHLLNECFSPHGRAFTLSGNFSLSFNDVEPNHAVLVFLHGEVAISRQYNNVLVGIAKAPFVHGLSTSLISRPCEYRYTAQTECVGYYFPSDLAISLLEKHQLWREAFVWLTWWYRIAETRDCQLIGSSTYDQIRASLLTMADWDEHLRLRIGVIQYIQRRTGVSRSVIAEILSALRKGNYIEMYKGKLSKINRLPYEY